MTRKKIKVPRALLLEKCGKEAKVDGIQHTTHGWRETPGAWENQYDIPCWYKDEHALAIIERQAMDWFYVIDLRRQAKDAYRVFCESRGDKAGYGPTIIDAILNAAEDA